VGLDQKQVKERQRKDDAFNELKSKVHLKLLNLLDLSRLTEASESALQEDLRRGVEMILAEDKIPLPSPEKERLCREIRNELLGYGPLEPLLADPGINDILVMGTIRCMQNEAVNYNLPPYGLPITHIYSRLLKK
jgi:pilus assembly protein CpaF